jgi:hypothetical protein
MHLKRVIQELPFCDPEKWLKSLQFHLSWNNFFYGHFVTKASLHFFLSAQKEGSFDTQHDCIYPYYVKLNLAQNKKAVSRILDFFLDIFVHPRPIANKIRYLL